VCLTGSDRELVVSDPNPSDMWSRLGGPRVSIVRRVSDGDINARVIKCRKDLIYERLTW